MDFDENLDRDQKPQRVRKGLHRFPHKASVTFQSDLKRIWVVEGLVLALRR